MTKRNQNRPGYKETKVGWIPKEWEAKRIQDISVINPESLRENTQCDYQFYYIDLSSVKDGKIEIPNNKTTFNEAPSRARRRIREEDVLLSTVRPNLKGFGIIDFNSDEYICSTGFAVLRLNEAYSSRYIYYNLFSHHTARYFYGCVVGSNYPALNNSDVAHLRIPLPPLPEQKKIAEILSAWDRAIEQTRKLIDARKRLKKGLMQQLLTGRMRFPEFIKSKERLSSHFFDYPKDWKHLNISKIAHEVTNRNWDNSDYPVISCSKYKGFVNSMEYFGKQVSSDDTSNYKIIKKYQFGFPANHVEEGSVGLLDHVNCGILSPIYIVFEVDQRMVNPPYLYSVFKTELYKHIFSSNTNASVNRRGSLRWKDFSKIRVPLPSFDEQIKIQSLLDSVDKEIDQLINKERLYTDQKKGLMQKLLTGEIRVTVAES